jgi:hypothetical protein
MTQKEHARLHFKGKKDDWYQIRKYVHDYIWYRIKNIYNKKENRRPLGWQM